jgi:hypothetical protein
MHDDDNGPPWKGRGPKLHDACEAAWEKAKGHTSSPQWFKVDSILVEGENPIRTYFVSISPTDPPD